MRVSDFFVAIAVLLAAIMVMPSISMARGEREYQAKQIQDIKIDGNLEEWAEWVEPDIIFMNEVFGGVSPDDPDDFTGSVMVAWSDNDSSRIYFAVKIRDDEFQDKGAQPWWTDSMEFIFDSDNNGSADQFTIGQDGALTHASANANNTEWVVVNQGIEYIWEAAITPAPGFHAKVGDAIGLALSYNDSENDVREHQIRWMANENAWGGALNQGELIFSAEIMKPAPVEPRGKLATTWADLKL
ncbi:sugar-binding protein [Candidatus Poribacteria bacterium]